MFVADLEYYIRVLARRGGFLCTVLVGCEQKYMPCTRSGSGLIFSFFSIVMY